MSTRRRKPRPRTPRAQRCIVCGRPATMELGAFLPNGDTATFTSCNRHELDVMSHLWQLAS